MGRDTYADTCTDIIAPAGHEPSHPDHEDEVPNQEAVNGIARAQRPRAPEWRDLALDRLGEDLPPLAQEDAQQQNVTEHQQQQQ